ncbi:hypothetical protein EDD41_0168 [Luteococcus japonicus]|uniref:Uncharacterized protein n=2 Tax=Luteococcus japonicus TaxID=33984 RepID=A0A1R4JLM4_9ACTN|nr:MULTISPECIES: hypothetical protein [Luteococcus]MDN5563875.1 hypothetical protein [Luteococcus sp.]ROR53046.1 hypothetical protein EDD41_0168 [Luteococcus japonicus]SJN32705.1 hypothetical protein FM114_08220 [Luteococcus japonicus LSP_Lj1]
MTTVGISRVDLRRELVALPHSPSVKETLVRVFLDGRRLEDWVEFLTGHSAGTWYGLHDGDGLPDLLRGEQPEYDGRTEVSVCSCTCSGCNPLLARIELTEHRVQWTGLAVGNGAVNPPEDLCLEFTIDRDAYLRALTALENWQVPIDG